MEEGRERLGEEGGSIGGSSGKRFSPLQKGFEVIYGIVAVAYWPFSIYSPLCSLSLKIQIVGNC